jgi:hypothetical protein
MAVAIRTDSKAELDNLRRLKTDQEFCEFGFFQARETCLHQNTIEQNILHFALSRDDIKG